MSISGRGKKISLLQNIPNSPQTHPACDLMGSGGSFPPGKVPGMSSWPLTAIYCWNYEWVVLYL